MASRPLADAEGELFAQVNALQLIIEYMLSHSLADVTDDVAEQVIADLRWYSRNTRPAHPGADMDLVFRVAARRTELLDDFGEKMLRNAEAIRKARGGA